jgi:predicted house-cleaning NTP pyrophosphatase (Maf/HAM1 superfamily)
VDGRGKGGSHVGRPKKFDFESMSKEELIQYIKVGEEIKKAAAYLRKQKKSIKS